VIPIVAGVVAKGDPLAALDWVQNFPEGPFFDQAAFGIISYIDDAHPKEASELATSISDSKLREEAIRRINVR
jgi:hypothetical protein